MRHRSIPVTVLLIFALRATVAVAQTQHRPASFDHPEDSLVSRIEFPELRGDSTAVIRCAVQVSRSGKMEDNGCYVNEAGDETFIKAINEAARKARLVPAMANGQPLRVYVQYQVEFRKEGDVQTVTIYNHPGVEENVKAYGVNHIAAQRALSDDEPWQKICPSRNRFAVLVRAHVAWDGRPSSVSFTPGNAMPITSRCEDAIRQTVLNSVFTPAFADGEPVPSTFVEPFGS